MCSSNEEETTLARRVGDKRAGTRVASGSKARDQVARRPRGRRARGISVGRAHSRACHVAADDGERHGNQLRGFETCARDVLLAGHFRVAIRRARARR